MAKDIPMRLRILTLSTLICVAPMTAPSPACARPLLASSTISVDRSAATPPFDTSVYANYGIWDFRIESMTRDARGDWQTFVWVRDAVTYRLETALDLRHALALARTVR